ncbi:MAG: DUF1849 family protein [Rhodospirillales bacterium]
MIRMFFRLGMFAAAVLAIVPAPLWAAELAPHRAFYSLNLGQTRPGIAVVGARGAMSIVLEKTCEGWITSQRLSMAVYTSADDGMVQEVDYTGWESLDGQSYRFASKELADGERKYVKGMALAAAPGSPGKAIYRTPEAKTIPLPAGTMFPAGHMAWLIDQALAGQRQAPRAVFDGIDGDGAWKVIAFIGPRVVPDKSRDVSAPLLERPGWKMRLAFYPLDSKASEPEYEVEVMQLDNGVATEIVLDHRMFTAIFKLEKIEAVPPPDC